MRKQAFTLVELLIGVTISSIVLTAAMVFLWSGIENAYRIRKSLGTVSRGFDFRTALSELQAMGGTVKHVGAFDAPYGTGILFETPNGHSPLTLFSALSVTGVCDAFSGTATDPGPKERLIIAEYFSKNETAVSGEYRVDSANHALRRLDNSVALGTGTPGKSGGDGGNALATELRFPNAVAAYGNGAFVADTGNDRILFVSWGLVQTFVGTEWGWRFPRSLAVSGHALWVAEGNRILKIADSSENGTSLFERAPVASAVTFDAAEVSVIPAVAGTLPTSISAYAFGGNEPSSVSVVGNAATLAFSGSALPAGNPAFSISPMSAPATAWGYAVQIVLKNSGSTVLDRTFPYFVRGDGRLDTMLGNSVSIVAEGLAFPHSVTDSGYESDIGSPAVFPNAAFPAARAVSDRLVENVSMSASGKILTVSYVEYVEFDCVSGRHAKRQKVFKIPLK